MPWCVDSHERKAPAVIAVLGTKPRPDDPSRRRGIPQRPWLGGQPTLRLMRAVNKAGCGHLLGRDLGDG